MTYGLKPCPEYKDSGLPWLGQIPAHWQIVRAKQLFRLRIEKAPSQHHMELLSVYTHIGVRPRKDLDQRGNKATTTDGYWIVNAGDIIVNKLLAWMGAVGVSHYAGVTSPAYDILRRVQSLNPDFYHYLFRTKTYLQQFKLRSRGIMEMRLRLYFDQLGQIPVVFPPHDEQEKIIRFLDAHTRLTNRFIRNRRRLIEVLNEQKQAVINQAVTRGLDPNVPLKPSGIEWLGDVPEHWEVARLHQLLRVQSGEMIASEDERPAGFPIYGGNGVRGYTDKWNTEGPIILLGRVGARCGCVHLVDGKFWASEHALRVQLLRPVSLGFLSMVLTATDLNRLAIRTAQPLINSTIARTLTVAIPPGREQAAIIDHIDRDTRMLDAACDSARREINLIREYRTRLIADVVTGRLDVRHDAPPPGAIESEDLEPVEAEEDAVEEVVPEDDVELVESADA